MPALIPENECPKVPDHQLVRRIGLGSYGEVWLARNVLGAHRAIKIVRRATFDEDRPYDREFAGIQQFEPISRGHEGLVDILQVGRNEVEKHFYYVMELADNANNAAGCANEIDGYAPKTLRQAAKAGALSAKECLEIALALTGALQHLHARGLVHRDIKPSNIIFINGVPKLADIGLVAHSSEARSYVGTEGFIPPEGPGTATADLYGLGKVLYEITTGKDRTEFPELPVRFRSEPCHSLTMELNEIVLKACANNLRERYGSAAEMRADLELAAAGKSVRRKRQCQRRVLVASGCGAAMALSAIILTGWRKEHPLTSVALALVVVAGGVALRRQFLERPGLPRASSGASPPAMVPPSRTTIAVLPLIRRGHPLPEDHFADGLADEIASVLSKCGDLKVASRTTSLALRNASNLREALKFKMDAIVDGTLEVIADRVELALQLSSPHDGFLVWSDSYHFARAEIFAVLTDLGEKIVRHLGLTPTETMRQGMAQKSTHNLEAYDLFLQARYHWNRRAPSDLEKAIALFEKSLEKDANNALAHAGLAEALGSSAYGFGRSNANAVRAKARFHADKSLALRPESGEAHCALAMVLFLLDWDWNGAEREFKIALRLNPDYPSVYHYYSAVLCAASQRFDEALALIRRGVELDPLSVPLNNFMGVILFMAGRDQEAAAAFHRTLELHPSYPMAHDFLAEIQLRAEQPEAALRGFLDGLRRNQTPESVLQSLADSYHTGGWAAFWSARGDLALNRWKENMAPWFVVFSAARSYALAGRAAEALDYLEMMFESRVALLVWLKLDPGFVSLQRESRFRTLLAHLRL